MRIKEHSRIRDTCFLSEMSGGGGDEGIADGGICRVGNMTFFENMKMQNGSEFRGETGAWEEEGIVLVRRILGVQVEE